MEAGQDHAPNAISVVKEIDQDIAEKKYIERLAMQMAQKPLTPEEQADAAARAKDKEAFIKKKKEYFETLQHFKESHGLGSINMLATVSKVSPDNIRAMLAGLRRPMSKWEQIIEAIKKIESESVPA